MPGSKNKNLKYFSMTFFVLGFFIFSTILFFPSPSLAGICNISGGNYEMDFYTCITTPNADWMGESATPLDPPPTVPYKPAGSDKTVQASLLPNVDSSSGIQEYIESLYIYAIGMVGIIATIVIMIGGLIWISSMGNAARVTSAKEWIGAALSGLALALFSYMILWIINPDLVNFKPLHVEVVKKTESASNTVDPDGNTYVYGCCQVEMNICANTNSYSCKKEYSGSFIEGGTCQNNRCNDTANMHDSQETCPDSPGNCKAWCQGIQNCSDGTCSGIQCHCTGCPDIPGDNTACTNDGSCKNNCGVYCTETAKCVKTSPDAAIGTCKCGDCIMP